MARKTKSIKKKSTRQQAAGRGTGPRGAGETEVQAARRRQHARKTKAPGLVTRERELAAARRELSTIQGTGVARRGQIAGAQATVKRAERALQRQRDAATRAGRPSS